MTIVTAVIESYFVHSQGQTLYLRSCLLVLHFLLATFSSRLSARKSFFVSFHEFIAELSLFARNL